MTEPAQGRLQADLVPLLIIALVAVLSRAVWFGDPAPDSDEQLYSLIGARMLDGALPYVHLWDRKPLGLFALYALAHAIGGPGPLAYQLLATAFAAAGGWLVYLLARDLSDRVTAIGAGVLYPLLIYAYGSLSGQSEVFFVPFVLASLLLLYRLREGDAGRRAVMAMLLAGTALQIKYSVLPQCLFLGSAALWHFRNEPPLRLIVRAATLVLAGLLPTLLAAGFYLLNGGFDAFVYANFVSIFERAPAQSGRFAAEHLAALLPLLALAASGLYLNLRSGRGRTTRASGLILGWSLSILAGIYMLSTVYLYYFAAFVPAALLLALPLLSVRNQLGWAPLMVVTGATLLLLNVPRHWKASQHARTDLARVTEALKPHVDGSRCLFVFDGPAALYRLTGSCLPSRFVYPDHLNNPLERQALGVPQEAEVARILAKRPGAIVIADAALSEQSSPSRELVARELSGSYRRIATAHVRDRSYSAWVAGERP